MKDGFMPRFYLADSQPDDRTALNLEVMGEASDWLSTLALFPGSRLNLQSFDWSLFPLDSEATSIALRTPIVIVLTNHLDVSKKAALSPREKVCIGKNKMPYRLTESL